MEPRRGETRSGLPPLGCFRYSARVSRGQATEEDIHGRHRALPSKMGTASTVLAGGISSKVAVVLSLSAVGCR